MEQQHEQMMNAAMQQHRLQGGGEQLRLWLSVINRSTMGMPCNPEIPSSSPRLSGKKTNAPIVTQMKGGKYSISMTYYPEARSKAQSFKLVGYDKKETAEDEARALRWAAENDTTYFKRRWLTVAQRNKKMRNDFMDDY